MGGLIGVATDDKDGLMPKGCYRKRDQLSGEVDLNNVLENGYYQLSSITNKINFPTDFLANFGMLEIVNPGYTQSDPNTSSFAVQKLWDFQNSNFFFRIKGGSGAGYKWGDWIKMQ